MKKVDKFVDVLSKQRNINSLINLLGKNTPVGNKIFFHINKLIDIFPIKINNYGH